MLLPILAVAAAASCAPDPMPPLTADTLNLLYAEGVPFERFLAEAETSQAVWEGNRERGPVDPDLVERARAVGSGWRILAVAEDWCTDSMHTVPYVATLLAELEGVEMRIVRAGPGRSVLERFRTPDDRAATPTFVLLSPEGAAAGCWVEQPAALQQWWLDPSDDAPESARRERKVAWYREEAGRETLREVVEMLEGAARGEPVCRGGPLP